MATKRTAASAAFAVVFQHSATGIRLVERDVLARFNPAAAALLELSEDARGQPLATALGAQPELLAALNSPEPDSAPVTLNNRREVQLTSAELKKGKRIALLEDLTARRAVDAGRDRKSVA